MKFITIKYNTSDEYFNNKATIYCVRSDEEVQKIIDDELQCFKDDEIIVYNYTVRTSTRDEIITYIEEEADKDDLIILVERLLSL